MVLGQVYLSFTLKISKPLSTYNFILKYADTSILVPQYSAFTLEDEFFIYITGLWKINSKKGNTSKKEIVFHRL